MFSALRVSPNGSNCGALGIVTLLLGLIAAPAHSRSIEIPYAPQVKVTSVTLWLTCPGDNGKEKQDCLKKRLAPHGALSKEMLVPGAPTTPQQLSSETLQAQTPLPSLEEKVITGMTDFLVARAKEEAKLYLEDLLTQDLCSQAKTDNGGNIFKNTCNTLRQLHNGSYSMSGGSSMLRAAIRKDLENYPEYRFAVASAPEAKRKWLYAMVGMAVFQESRGSRAISEIIGGLSAISDLKSTICPASYDRCESDLNDLADKAKLYWYLSENYRGLREYLKSKNQFDTDNRIAAVQYVVASALSDQHLKTVLEGVNTEDASRRLTGIVSVFETIQTYREHVTALDSELDNSTTGQANLAMRLGTVYSGINALIQIEYALCRTPGACAQDERRIVEIKDASGIADAALQKDYPRVATEAIAFAEDGQSAYSRPNWTLIPRQTGQ